MKQVRLIAFAALTFFAAQHARAESCDENKAFEAAIQKVLAKQHLGLSQIDKVTKQSDGTYFIEYTYVGEDFQDSGMAVLSLNENTCVASSRKK